MDRSIPHVRDIFSGSWDQTQQLQKYTHSPRTRRRRDTLEDYIEEDSPEERHHHSAGIPRSKSTEYRRSDNKGWSVKDCGSMEDDWNKKQQNGHYSSRTLTEKDIRHLERHLSMKKTIRKQISRNLAQAFVEDPKCLQIVASDNQPKGCRDRGQELPQQQPQQQDKTFTLTRAKMSKSEQNVLDMLKDGRQDNSDSGHSSPVHHGSSEEEAFESKPGNNKYRPALKAINDHGNANAPNPRPSSTETSKIPSSSSFWKMFNLLGKNKR